jgi:hypothetical protein
MVGRLRILGLIVLVVCAATLIGADAPKGKGPTNWSFNATIIEACSCPMFCQCYFSTEPAGHAGMGEHAMHGAEHFCKFNNAYHINKGTHMGTKLDGAKFWVSGDLGAEFSDGEMDWAVLTFDPSVTKEQRDGIAAILGHVYPVKWKSFTVAADAPMEWTATKDRAVAKLDGGKTAEVVLNRFQGMSNEPIVIHNLKYFGVPRNDGFLMMPNEVEAYRIGDKAFEYKGTNGFMITLDINDKDVMAAAKN